MSQIPEHPDDLPPQKEDAASHGRPRDELEAGLAALDAKLSSYGRKEESGIEMPVVAPMAMKAGRIAFELMLAMLLGLFLGWAGDRALDTLPLFMLLGGGIGFAAGVWNAWRAMNGSYTSLKIPPSDRREG